jgi:xanthosine utilization system XapX-like protein
MKNYSKLTLGIMAAWFVISVTASALHVFENAVSGFGAAIAIASSVPLLLFAVWYGISEKFREFVLSVNPQILTLLQAGRLIGFTFVLLEARQALPAVFALPAGYGDMLIGATATFAAWKLATPSRRTEFMLWQALGITDLVLAVSLGTTARLLSPFGTSMGAMTVLPLSLVPTFLVPLYLIFHAICIAQARRWLEFAALKTA